MDPVIPVHCRQLPLVAGREETIGERHMFAQLIRMHRHAPTRQIGRSGTDDTLDRHDLSRDQARRLQVRGAQRQIEAALHRIDLLVAENQVNLEFGILLHEIGDGRTELQRSNDIGALTRSSPRGVDCRWATA